MRLRLGGYQRASDVLPRTGIRSSPDLHWMPAGYGCTKQGCANGETKRPDVNWRKSNRVGRKSGALHVMWRLVVRGSRC